MNAMSRSFLGLAAAALVAAGVSACGSDDDPPAKAAARTQAGPAIQSADLLRAVSRKTYVGKVAGTDAYIGVDTAEGRPARVYVCDGTGKGEWVSPSDAHLVRHGDGFAGSVVVDGVPHDFSTVRATGPGGVFTFADGSVRATWIVLADGSRKGSATKDGKPVAGEVSPEDGTAVVDGDTVAVGSGGGVTPFRKTARTKQQRCDALLAAYQLNTAAMNTFPVGSSDYNFHKAMADNALQAGVDAGCFDAWG
jgi:hypothetical protein